MSTYVLRKGIAALADLKDGYASILAAANNIYHVDKNHASASDVNSGLDRNKPLLTITQAYNNCTDSLGDVIIIHGANTRYRETDTLTIAKDGITILGDGWGCEWNNNGKAGGYVVKVAAKGVRIANIQLSVNDSGGGIYVGDNGDDSNASLCMIENCFIRGDWLNESTGYPGAGILKGVYNYGASLMTLRNCHIWGWTDGVWIQDGVTRTSYGAHIYGNYITMCSHYGIHWEGLGYTSVIDSNVLWDIKASINFTYAIHLAESTGGIMVSGNKIGAANPVYDSGDLNYWCGNFIRATEAASETQAVGMCAIDAVV
ncbi:MAG: right-handed parallel beta-helix repeat-containing protein, partial [Gammaproteobacteria bacterium]|nr:right-handed parallel beta-helix repeat-containing protein [Gammaproteobacteria bacterium]